jgi:hypothetical protein
MINFTSSTTDDLEQISEWIQHDPYHFHLGHPEWWLTGVKGSLLAFCLMDERGPLTYVRLDEEGGYVRIHTQFAPESVVSKRRLVVGMLKCMESLIGYFKELPDKKGMIFNSVSPTLVAFMCKRLGFKPVEDDDYQLDFEVQK